MGKITVHNIFGEQDEKKRNEYFFGIILEMIEERMAEEKESKKYNENK